MNKLILILFTILLILIILWQAHEYQHYTDFKENNCTNISYQVIRVKAYCNDTIKMQELIDYRDKQVITLWFNVFVQ